MALGDIVATHRRDFTIDQLHALVLSAQKRINTCTESDELLETLLQELTEDRRRDELLKVRNHGFFRNIISAIRSLPDPDQRLAGLCFDKLSFHVPYMLASDLAEILEWMVKKKVFHTKFVETISRMVTVIPMTDTELSRIVSSILTLNKGELRADQEFLERYLKFRLAITLET